MNFVQSYANMELAIAVLDTIDSCNALDIYISIVRN